MQSFENKYTDSGTLQQKVWAVKRSRRTKLAALATFDLNRHCRSSGKDSLDQALYKRRQPF